MIGQNTNINISLKGVKSNPHGWLLSINTSEYVLNKLSSSIRTCKCGWATSGSWAKKVVPWDGIHSLLGRHWELGWNTNQGFIILVDKRAVEFERTLSSEVLLGIRGYQRVLHEHFFHLNNVVNVTFILRNCYTLSFSNYYCAQLVAMNTKAKLSIRKIMTC